MKQSSLILKSTLIFIAILNITNLFSQLIPFCEKGKWGFATTNGEITISCIYDEVSFFSIDNLAKVEKAGKYGFINSNGIEIIPIIYEKADFLYNVFRSENGIGVLPNPDLHLTKGALYDDYLDNRFVVEKNKKKGVLQIVNQKPKTIIPFNFDRIQYDCEKKTFVCTIVKNSFYFSKNGESISLEYYTNIERQENYGPSESKNGINLEIVSENGKYGLIQKSDRSYESNIILNYRYNQIEFVKHNDYDWFSIDEELFAVKIDNNWGFSMNKDLIVLPIEYDQVNLSLSNYYRHWARFKWHFYCQKNGKWGLIGAQDKKGDTLETLLPFEFDKLEKIYFNFIMAKSEGGYQVFNLEKYQFISDKKYTSISKYEHEGIGKFKLFVVKNNIGQDVFLGENGVEFFKE